MFIVDNYGSLSILAITFVSWFPSKKFSRFLGALVFFNNLMKSFVSFQKEKKWFVLLYLQFNSQNSSVSSQAGLGIGVQAPGVNPVAVTSGSLQQQPNSFQQSNQQALMTSGAKDSGTIQLLFFILQWAWLLHLYGLPFTFNFCMGEGGTIVIMKPLYLTWDRTSHISVCFIWLYDLASCLHISFTSFLVGAFHIQW